MAYVGWLAGLHATAHTMISHLVLFLMADDLRWLPCCRADWQPSCNSTEKHCPVSPSASLTRDLGESLKLSSFPNRIRRMFLQHIELGNSHLLRIRFNDLQVPAGQAKLLIDVSVTLPRVLLLYLVSATNLPPPYNAAVRSI